jgi:hypothetical protein
MPNYARKEWTIAENKQLENLCSGSIPFRTIAERLNRSCSSCISHARHLKIKNPYIRRIYSVNHQFWDTPNEINCYWAGFAAADASIRTRGKHFSFALELQQSDEGHLQSLANACGSNYPFYYTEKPDNKSKTVRLIVNSDIWADKLKNNFNLVPLKTKRLKPPDGLNDYLLFCWLIGYIDGDGCIHLRRAHNTISISFVSASEYLIKWINDFLSREFPQKLRRRTHNTYKDKRYNCWYLRVEGIRGAIIFDFLSKFPVPKLSRKWNNPNIINRVGEIKRDYPSFFNKSMNIDTKM